MRRSNTTRTSSSSSSIDSNSSSNYQLPLTSSASDDHHQNVATSSSIVNDAHKNNYSNYFLDDLNSKRNIKSSSSSSDMSTDLQLGLSLSANFHTSFILSSSREELASGDSPSQMRRAATTAAAGEGEKKSTCTSSNLFVKVKMEGSRICRKVDLLAHSAYPSLITTLQHLFTTPNILWAEEEQCCNHHTFTHVLTYQDQEGDWMMVGDVPWEMFLTAVKRLKITRTDSSCF